MAFPKKRLTSTLLTLAGALSLWAIDGDWKGQLNAGPISLNLVLHLDGPTPTMDSPDQGAEGIAITIGENTDSSISFSVPAIGFTFNGALEGEKLKGTIKQMGLSFPIEFERGALQRLRPQTPQPPFPYDSETVSVESDGAILGGTLIPPSSESTPLVVFATGSGLQDRDETLFDHRPFLVLADRLARRGVGSLRCDDRGCGDSPAPTYNITLLTDKEDILAQLRYLKSRFPTNPIGIIGHSSGAEIALLLAAEHPELVTFVVAIAPPAMSGAEILDAQYRVLAPALNASQREESIRNSRGQNAWMDSFLDFDPSETYSRIETPVFAIFGEKDVQVDAERNGSILSEILSSEKNQAIKTYAGLNHLMQYAVTGRPDEYPVIEETMSEEVISDIVEFIISTSNVD